MAPVGMRTMYVVVIPLFLVVMEHVSTDTIGPDTKSPGMLNLLICAPVDMS